MAAKESIFLENSEVKIELKNIDFEYDRTAVDFLYKIVKYADETEIYKLICTKGYSELDGQFVTGFRLETNSEILLQRITEIDREVSSEIIRLDKANGTVESVQIIGLYELINYNIETNVLTGFNLNETRQFKLELI